MAGGDYREGFIEFAQEDKPLLIFRTSAQRIGLALMARNLVEIQLIANGDYSLTAIFLFSIKQEINGVAVLKRGV